MQRPIIDPVSERRRGMLAVIDALAELGRAWNENETAVNDVPLAGDTLTAARATDSREREPERRGFYHADHP